MSILQRPRSHRPIAPCLAAILSVAACFGTFCRASDLMPPSFERKSAKAPEVIPLGIWISSI